MFHRKTLGIMLSLSTSTLGASACTAADDSLDDEEKIGSYAAAIGETWSAGHSLSATRESHTATVLNSGSRFLVAGGKSGSTALASADLCNAGGCAATGTMTQARFDHVAVQLADGKVLVAGGDSGSGSLDSAEVFDPDAGTWSSGGTMDDPRSQATATLLADGRVLVVGGVGASNTALDTAEIYDPGSNSWTTTGSMAQKRKTHVAALLNTGKVLIAGGYFGSSSLQSAELFDPAGASGAGSFGSTGSLGYARSGATAVVLADGSNKVLVAGGIGTGGALTSSELYNPSAGTFASTSGGLSTGRRQHAAVLLPDGRVVVAGGMTGAGSPIQTAEAFSPSAGTWSTLSAMGTARKELDAVVLLDGRVVAVGGNDGSASLSGTEIWSPPYVLDPAQTSDLTQIGGSGGAEFEESCPSGHVAVGFAGTYGSYGIRSNILRRLALHCRELKSNGTLGASTDTAAQGDGGGTAFDVTCPSGKILWKQKIGVDGFVNYLEGACERFELVATAGTPDSPPWITAVAGSGTPSAAACPAGYAVTGFHGRSGGVIDKLGFRCTEVVIDE